MKLYDFILEITLPDALKLFGLTSDDVGDKDKITKAYRQAALKAHPDHGGSHELMQIVNDAKEVLDASEKKSNHMADFHKRQADDYKLGIRVRDILIETFVPANFIAFFEQIFGGKFEYKIISRSPENESSYIYNAGFRARFSNAENTIVFDMYVSADIHNANITTSLGGGEDNVSFPLFIDRNITYYTKKIKLSRQEWQKSTNHDALINPDIVFPEKTLHQFDKKIENKKFSKADMVNILTQRGGMSWDGEDARKTLIGPRELYIRLIRNVFMKIPNWSAQLYANGTPVKEVKYHKFPETAEVGEFFVDLVKQLQNENTKDEMIKKYNLMIEPFYAKIFEK